MNSNKIIYKNNSAKESEIIEIGISTDNFKGKKLYAVECLYRKHSIAPNGSVCDKALLSTYVSKEQHNKPYLLNYLNERIKNTTI